MKILALAGSNSKNSINKKLVIFAASLFINAEINLLDLNDFEMPIYSIDRQKENGIPELAQSFSTEIKEADLILISLAEHNGAYSVAFKNIFDWFSRIPNQTAWLDKPMFLLATSPGARGGSSVLEMAKNRFPFNGGKVLDTFSLPSFNDNFDEQKGITNLTYLENLKAKIQNIIEKLSDK